MQSAVLAIVNLSVRLSVCHMLALCQYDSCYDYAVFTGGEPHDSSFLLVNFSTKFRREHRAPNERGVGNIGNF